jgi:lipoate-protein ligase A
MKYLDLTWPTPEANLACDEALLDWCEAEPGQEILRVWEPSSYFVVIGYANESAREVHLAACLKHQVPVLRRISGGGAVVQGPGCLNYSLVLRIEEEGPLATIPSSNRFIMERNRAALAALAGSDIQVRGHTDLALGERKFSGNAQRRKRQFLLFHGSFLLSFDLGRIESLLPRPSKEPFYRGARGHLEFLTNLSLSADAVKAALRNAWSAETPVSRIPQDIVEQLLQAKYSRPEWHFKA